MTKTVSKQQILESMEYGKGYSKNSFELMFPDVDREVLLQAVSELARSGKIWNGNQYTFVRFEPKASDFSGDAIICPAHNWDNLKGYGEGMKLHRDLSESTRGEGYKARPHEFTNFQGKGGEWLQTRHTRILRGQIAA